MCATWNSLSDDPNSPAAQSVRRETLRRARAPQLITDRERYLANAVKGLKILDVGVVAHTRDAYQSPGWLHRHLVQSAASCLGCDILSAEIDHLRGLGFNVLCRDVTAEPIDDTFDAMVCGELIEHLNAPGALFASAARMLRDGGTLYLSTPNPWFLTYLLKNLMGREPLVDSVDHVAWFDPSTLCELGERYGFVLKRYTGIKVTRTYTLKARLFFALGELLLCLGLRRELFAKSIVYEFVKAGRNSVRKTP